MAEYRSNIELAEVARRLGEAQRVMVTTHAKPDGDAFGAVVSLTAALRGMGKDVAAWLMPMVPENLKQLRGFDLINIFHRDSLLGEVDLVVVLDTGASSQLAPMLEQLEAYLPKTLIIDHHLNGDLPTKWRYVDQTAAACCEIIEELLCQLNVGKDDPVIRDGLFVGIAADTGWFRFSNTRPRTHEMAARLLRAGVDHADLHAKLQQNERPEKLALMTHALRSLQLLRDHRVALMVLNADDFLQTGADVSDTEQFVDMPQIVGTVQTVVLIVQPPSRPDGRGAGGAETAEPVRVSFRSKPGPHALNVAEIAGRFGGGGHARAAGAKISSPLDDVVRQVTAAVLEQQPNAAKPQPIEIRTLQ